MADFDYDLFVVGAGSGGVRAAREAENWRFRFAQSIFLSPGRMLIASDRTGGVLEGIVSPHRGLQPVRTVAGLGGQAPRRDGWQVVLRA